VEVGRVRVWGGVDAIDAFGAAAPVHDSDLSTSRCFSTFRVVVRVRNHSIEWPL